MNSIQKALKMQGIDVTWSGPEPDNINKISNAYLEGKVDGFPRITRSLSDEGNQIVLKQLKEDFKTIIKEEENAVRIRNIKQKAGEIIEAKFPAYKQRNLITKVIMISLAEEISEMEEKELEGIFDAWEWIDLVRYAANNAEITGVKVKDIIWPDFPPKN